jgi:hypothetical protein
MQLERKQHELEATKQRLSQLQERFDQSTAEFEQRLDLARDKERQLLAVSAFVCFRVGEIVAVPLCYLLLSPQLQCATYQEKYLTVFCVHFHRSLRGRWRTS